MLSSHLNYIFSLVFLTNKFSESQIKQLKLHAGTLDWFNIHRARQIFLTVTPQRPPAHQE